MEYEKVKQNEEFSHDTDKKLVLICCDCGLVHDFDVNIRTRKEITIRVARKDRATTIHRKQHLSDLRNLEKEIKRIKALLRKPKKGYNKRRQGTFTGRNKNG